MSQDEWLVERRTLLEHEKELTKHYDRVNAERRQLPTPGSEKSCFRVFVANLVDRTRWATLGADPLCHHGNFERILS